MFSITMQIVKKGLVRGVIRESKRVRNIRKCNSFVEKLPGSN